MHQNDLQVVLFKDVTTYLVLLTFAIGAARLQGAGRMFQDCDWAVLLTNGQVGAKSFRSQSFLQGFTGDWKRPIWPKVQNQETV